jgi:hypothetical protein
MVRTRPETLPKAFTAFRKNIVAFGEDLPGKGCAAVEDAKAKGVITTMGIEDAEAVPSS